MFDDRYTFGTRVTGPLADVRERVTAALRTEGFGVLTEIDVAATLKAKIDADIAPYLILGACNPPFALRAIATDPSIGALLPCNVVLRADGDEVVVEVMDPKAVLGLVGDARIDEVADEIRARLRRMVDVIASQASASQSPVTEPSA